ncbi:aldehyde dehydrogenase family protein [Allosaccharopolyspora coralli]|uniref:Aldehyde dehydrogenase family protein n=1 Tax=Allosaccharopolyspora coralli TaxID=2665642 RepID=A0A5Q3QFP5_9PSEU|nr:aldehyde dehydrogenase family protein [Allosaccharopolyspora coralli]QGK70355.1 aldehyde dehydrogenase family protein [Allosaccharopolyspora coralli]
MTLTIKHHLDEVGLADGRLFVSGTWRQAKAGATWAHRHPATGETVGTVAVADTEDVDDAVRAARRAFDDGPWPSMRAGERMRIVRRCGDLLREHADELRSLQALDNGVPLSFGTVYAGSVDIAADAFEHHAGWIDKAGGQTLPPFQGGDHMAMTLREPIGVVAAILPWNAPFLLFAQKIAPALAAGCTVVIKPSEHATFCVLRMVELLAEAGVPDGVVNLVSGPGEPTGDALIHHPGVDKISFTGSRATGQRIVSASAEGFTRVSLELGGKSPAVVFPDADAGLAGMTAMGMVTLGLSGQACVAHTRALVHRDVYDEFVGAAEMIAGSVTYGDPFDPEVLSGPLVTEAQLEKVLGYVEQGCAAGARLVTGGERVDGELAAGNYVTPAVFADVDNRMSIAREEIFGPVLSVVPFDDEDEAVAMANDTEYGLGAGVFTRDAQRALRVSKRLRCGMVGVNGFQVEPHVPFGGYKQSGLGREGGLAAFESYTELKSVLMPLTDEMM